MNTDSPAFPQQSFKNAPALFGCKLRIFHTYIPKIAQILSFFLSCTLI